MRLEEPSAGETGDVKLEGIADAHGCGGSTHAKGNRKRKKVKQGDADGGETERDGGARTMDDDDDASCG